MKKLIVTLVILSALIIGGVVAAKSLLGRQPNDLNDANLSVSQNVSTPDESMAGSSGDVDPIKIYNNGSPTTFTYDSTKLVFEEMPSDVENGYPMTSFLCIDSVESLPRLDVVPLTMEAPIPATLLEGDWSQLAKTMLLAYYNETERDKVVIEMSTPIVEVEGDTAKLFVSITTTLDGSATPNMNGAVRMVTKGTDAVITLALAEKGSSVPQEMSDVYMSATIS